MPPKEATQSNSATQRADAEDVDPQTSAAQTQPASQPDNADLQIPQGPSDNVEGIRSLFSRLPAPETYFSYMNYN